MTKPDESVRRVIDEESVRPRLNNQHVYLAQTKAHPLPVARADLLYLWDDYRGEYLDFAARNNPVGHNHPLVSQAVSEHLRYYGFVGPQGHHSLRWPVEYAKQLSDCFTGQSEDARQVLYCEGEREAIRVAVDAACRDSARTEFAVAGFGYGAWIAPHRFYSHNFLPGEAVWDGVGALLINPVSPGARLMDPAVIRDWIIAARKVGVPVIYDESRTGFGRLGTMWGQERSGLTADLTVLGGPAGGGWPFGAVVGPRRFFRDTPEGMASFQAGHPVICRAGSTTLDVVGVGVLEYMEDTSALLAKGLDEICAQFPHYVSDHHGEGLLRGLRFSSDETALRFSLDCRAHGLYVDPPVGVVVVLAPPLIISTNEMTRGVDLIAATLLAWDDGSNPV